MLSVVTSILALPTAVEYAAPAAELTTKFTEWKSQFAKAYKTVEEEAKALEAFTSNEAIILEHNAKKLSYTLGHNAFSDLTWAEFEAHYMGNLFLNRSPKNYMRKHLTGIGQAVNASVDWVSKGAVTPVKNQARCGSCWAFSTTGSVEGAYQIANKELLSLSEEDLVQCDHNGDRKRPLCPPPHCTHKQQASGASARAAPPFRVSPLAHKHTKRAFTISQSGHS